MYSVPSFGDATFRQRIDHEQRNIVNAQLQIMSMVPLAFGELVQPCFNGNVAFDLGALVGMNPLLGGLVIGGLSESSGKEKTDEANKLSPSTTERDKAAVNFIARKIGT